VVPYLTFTYCNTPFVYLLDGAKGIDFIYQDGTFEQTSGYSLSPLQSQVLFNRDKKINKVIVHIL